MNPADDDHTLLARYATQRCEDSLRQLVARHPDLVYSAAHRQTSAPHLAEEAAQSVFIELSRSAARIRPNLPLAASDAGHPGKTQKGSGAGSPVTNAFTPKILFIL